MDLPLRPIFSCLASLLIAAAPLAAAAAPDAEILLCDSATRAIDAAATATLAQGSPGMIVEIAQGGRTLFSRSYGLADLEQETPVERHSVFQIASITKTFTAAAILSLIAEGRLTADDRVGMFVPELSVARDVRVYDLLVQTSGIPDFTDDPSLERGKSVERSADEMIDLIASRSGGLNFDPGTRWEYSNSNYVLLGVIAERVTGENLQAIFDERLLRPAALTSIRFDHPSDVVAKRVRGYRKDTSQKSGFRNAAWISPSIPGAAGGLRGDAPDLIGWSEALFGGKVLGEKWVRLMSSPGRLRNGQTTKSGMPEEWRVGLDSDYGMGLFIKKTRGGTRFAHSGDIDGFSTWLAYYPASGVTIVQMINSESADLNVDAVEASVFSENELPCIQPVG